MNFKVGQFLQYVHLEPIRTGVNIRALDSIGLTGRRGIAPTRSGTHLLKNVLNLFVSIKLIFFIRNKTRPRRPRIQF